jgi:hypothetical protein
VLQIPLRPGVLLSNESSFIGAVEFAKICPSVGNIPAAECQFRLLAPTLEPRASQLEFQLCIWWGLGQFNVTKALAVADNRV